MLRTAAIVSIVLLGCLTLLGAADKPAAAPAPKDLTFTDPAKAGPDFEVQGEYAGDKLGAQIVALGGGKFQAAFYAGGLPGDGWDGKTRVEAPGERAAAGDAAFAGGGWSASLARGELAGQTDKADKFRLKKVQRKSSTEGAKPPEGAKVLFDGSNTDAWANAHTDDVRHLLAAGTKTKQTFGAKPFTLHAEFLLPFKPAARDQDRGNSGIYLQDRYEVQVLDSFGLPPLFNGCGTLYRQTAPAVNMCYPPLSWQTYDIDFTPPKFDDAGKKTANAVITVKHNGVAIHDNREVTAKTGAGQPEGPKPGPITLQGHGNPVYFRNVWIVEK